MKHLAVAFFLLASAPAIAANAVIERVTNGFVLPSYQAFAAEGRDMKSAMDALCQAGSAGTLQAARSAFVELVQAWSRVELMRFGPVTADNRIDRVLFWPDRKGIGLRQVQAALANEDESATQAASLRDKSVAMQGLGTLEFILFGTGAEVLEAGSGSHRCRFGSAVSGNIASIGAGIVTEWQGPEGFAATWADPGPDNMLYRTDDEAMGELLDIFVHGLEQIRDVRINGFLGGEPVKDNSRTAIYRRSSATVASLEANMGGLRDLFAVADFPSVLADDAGWIADSIRFEFANADRAMEGLSLPVEQLLSDADRREKIGYLRLITSSLSEFFGVKLSAALGLTAGFSSLDGD